MTAAELIKRQSGPFERLFDALVDPARGERTMAFLLAGYAAVWTLYGIIAKSSQDIHADMGEIAAGSREFALGTPKHPPLAAWLVRVWFGVMPAEAWAYYLFAVIVATSALWIAWRLAAHYLPGDKRIVGIALLTLVPFYNFHALKFNANTVLLPFWAATTWWFLRALETRRAGWAALAEIGAAAAMLGKYWSIFLIAGLGLAALTDWRRRAYFGSPAPWLTIAIGAVLLAPHALWVVGHDFSPFGYALATHASSPATAAASAVLFIAGTLAYIAAPIGLGALAARPSLIACRDTAWPADPSRRTIAVAFAAPLVLPALAAIPLQVKMISLWAMPAMTLFPVVLLSSPLLTISRQAAVRLLALALVFPLAMVAVSPAIALFIHRHGVKDYESHYRLIAQALEAAWRERTDRPLRIVGGYPFVADGVAFYIQSQRTTFYIPGSAHSSSTDADAIARDGIAVVCPAPEIACVRELGAYAARYPSAEVKDVTLARDYFGTFDPAVTYRILTIPPQSP